jgi:hypothetical protein
MRKQKNDYKRGQCVLHDDGTQTYSLLMKLCS